MAPQSILPVGIYEKALPPHLSWEERFHLAAKAGYDFVEMSVDESEQRLNRLTWTPAEKAALRDSISATGIPIRTMGLSAHRKYPLGSASAETRRKGLDILFQALELASDLGIRIIQLMGYDVFYEPSDSKTDARYQEGLRKGAERAGTYGIMLGLENVDCDYVNSIDKALRLVHQINSPWLQVYPDMGNLFAAGYDPVTQFPLAEGHIVGVHVKDALPDVVRGVPFEAGQVPFLEIFQTLASMNYSGPLVVEMWAHLDETRDPIQAVSGARRFVDRIVQQAWMK